MIRDERPFKFRAWIKPELNLYPEGCYGMREVYTMNFHGYPVRGIDHITVLANDNSAYLMVPKGTYVLMQYTGLEDKNGKDIYEGDIVNGGCYNGSYQYGVVEYVLDSFMHTNPHGESFGYELNRDHRQIEVIGNIYENPNLIKIQP